MKIVNIYRTKFAKKFDLNLNPSSEYRSKIIFMQPLKQKDVILR